MKIEDLPDLPARKPPKRDDEASARRWRGPLFDYRPLSLKWLNGVCFEALKPPRSITFPICALCNHVIWEWPHFEELVAENAICTQCFREEQAAQERDAGRDDW